MIKKELYKWVFAVLSVFMVCGCRDRVSHDSDGKVAFERVDIAVADYGRNGLTGQVSVPDSMIAAVRLYGSMMGVDASDVDSILSVLSVSAPVRVFSPDVRPVYESVDSLERVVGKMNGQMKRYLPRASFSRVFTIVSPYRQSVIISDSLCFVALNHYLGADYPGYGTFSEYQRRFKTSRHMPYDIAEAAVAVAYPYENDGTGTVLSRMLYEGALVDAVMSLVPDADLAEALGYSPQQLEWAEKNEHNVWNSLITNKLLYSTSGLDADRVVSAMPFTTAVGPDVPGRIGRYTGYRIVRDYKKEYGSDDAAFLLSPSFYSHPEDVLVKARYAP